MLLSRTKVFLLASGLHLHVFNNGGEISANFIFILCSIIPIKRSQGAVMLFAHE
jgi:hypothetical protein